MADDKVKGAATPRVKRSEDQVIEGRTWQLLNPEGARMFRSGRMRSSYLGQERAEIQNE